VLLYCLGFVLLSSCLKFHLLTWVSDYQGVDLLAGCRKGFSEPCRGMGRPGV
jgi:hypothetical protein